MALLINDGERNVLVGPIIDALELGSGDAEMRIYSGPRPSVNSPPTGTLLVTCLFDTENILSTGTFDGTLLFNPLEPGVSIANGDAAWFRAVSDIGVTVFDGSVGLVASGADLELNTLGIAIGVVVNVNTMSIIAGNDI